MLRKEYAENPFQKEEYGRLLKLALGRRNQKQFCEDAGLSRSYINKYINAMMDKPPTIGTDTVNVYNFSMGLCAM